MPSCVGRPACTAGIAVSLYRFPGVILCRPSSPLVLDRCDLGLGTGGDEGLGSGAWLDASRSRANNLCSVQLFALAEQFYVRLMSRAEHCRHSDKLLLYVDS